MQIDYIANFLAASAAIGTAAFGLVDASKAFRGGISNIGFGQIAAVLQGFSPALRQVNPDDPFQTIKANWLNGMDKAAQKAAAKSLVRLGITPQTAPDLAAAVSVVDPAQFAAAAQKIKDSQPLTAEEVDLLGRFDAILEARMDAAFERADQLYRNACKVAAAVVAVLLAVISDGVINGDQDLGDAILVGILATPLAPMAKDITTALNNSAAALKAMRG